MNIRFGNLTVKQFAERVGADFTERELEVLESHRTDIAAFTDPNKFHIFDSPAVSIDIGKDALEATSGIWNDANTRATFNRQVAFYESAIKQGDTQ